MSYNIPSLLAWRARSLVASRAHLIKDSAYLLLVSMTMPVSVVVIMSLDFEDCVRFGLLFTTFNNVNKSYAMIMTARQTSKSGLVVATPVSLSTDIISSCMLFGTWILAQKNLASKYMYSDRIHILGRTTCSSWAPGLADLASSAAMDSTLSRGRNNSGFLGVKPGMGTLAALCLRCWKLQSIHNTTLGT